jgi:MazG family protein
MTQPPEGPSASFDDLLRLAERLRRPDGCAWDREQTVRSLARHLVEEALEVLDAAESGNDAAASAELGDLAFVLALALRAATDAGGPGPATVLGAADRKIRQRHPHVFGGAAAESSASRWRLWEEAKRSEGKTPEAGQSRSSDLLPGLLSARKLQERAAGFGFDWKTLPPVLEKVKEELQEVEDAIAVSPEETRGELGDLLFSIVNLGRFLQIDAEGALRAANEKFRRRFDALLARAQATGRNPEDMTLEELDAIWDQLKADERGDDGVTPDRSGIP